MIATRHGLESRVEVFEGASELTLGATRDMWLMHGTTFSRAESIVEQGPDIHFVEPGGMVAAENISFTSGGVPSAVGNAPDYARNKAAAFPNEGGPAILLVDVTEEVVRMAAIEHLSLFGTLIAYDKEASTTELIDLCGGVI